MKNTTTHKYNISGEHKALNFDIDVYAAEHQPNTLTLNLLSPHDALKHHFTSLKTDLIFLQQRVLERKFL